MSSPDYDIAIIGGGIIGLATALQLAQRHPRRRIVIIEKEDRLAAHQTGHNSGVIHSGIYYRPDSQKAKFCVSGVEALLRFCDENQIHYEQCGKVIVATDAEELPRLEALYERGKANGVEGLELIGPERLREIEPHAAGLKALHAPRTGIIDYTQVALAYAQRVQEGGGDIFTGTKVMKITASADGLAVETNDRVVQASHVINCAGLYADQVARMMGVEAEVRIVPFRGEYYVLQPHAKHLVTGLIYPVPDPRFPFLGVHFTRTIHGEVEAGPNAVLALAREGYTKRAIHLSEALGILTYRGFWTMSRRYWRIGLNELYRSVRKKVFVHDLQRLVPAITVADVVAGGTGVRAQALRRDGVLLDDFSIHSSRNAIHILNAPSPGATSSLTIGQYIAELAANSWGFPT